MHASCARAQSQITHPNRANSHRPISLRPRNRGTLGTTPPPSQDKHGSVECNSPSGKSLLPQLPDGHVHVAVLLHDLSDRHLEVFLCHVDASLPQREHTRLRAHRLRKPARERKRRGTAQNGGGIKVRGWIRATARLLLFDAKDRQQPTQHMHSQQ